MRALKIVELAEVMRNKLAYQYGYKPEDIKIKDIGVRHGEKMHESLFGPEECIYMYENDKLLVLKNSILDKPNFNLRIKSAMYNSGNINLLNKEEIAEILIKDNII